MTTILHDDAKTFPCPIARTFADQPKAVSNCRGEACILWRWEQVTVSHPNWRKAVLEIAAEKGEKAPYKNASRQVADDPLSYGLVVERGWCGLGGQP